MPCRANPLYFSVGEFSTAPFCVACDSEGALVAAAFGNFDSLLGRILQPAADLEIVPVANAPALATAALAAALAQVAEYFAGNRHAFTLPLRKTGTPFQQRVHDALLEIPIGETRTYGQLAKTLTPNSAPRAVGRAAGRNPLALFVPCHRLVGAGGKLTGFAFGIELKAQLLDLERAPAKRTNLSEKSCKPATAR